MGAWSGWRAQPSPWRDPWARPPALRGSDRAAAPWAQADRGDLGLVTDLREEKSAQRWQECARPARPVIVALIFVRKQRPHGDAEERNSKDPAHPRATEQAAKKRAGEPGGGMVCERGEEDPEAAHTAQAFSDAHGADTVGVERRLERWSR